MSYKDYKIGERLKVEVVAIPTYGIFATLDEETKGLIHISEIKHGYMEEDLKDSFEIGQELDVAVLDIDEYDGRISLSLRALEEFEPHKLSKRKTNPRYGKTTGTGFESLGKKMPGWLSGS